MLEDFKAFLTVDRQYRPKTVYEHYYYVKRFIEWLGGREADREAIREFLRPLLERRSAYSNVLKALKVFFRDYLGVGELVEGFRFPPQTLNPPWVPSRKELREFYEAIPIPEGRLYFLLYASSGLRTGEALSLRPQDVDEELRMLRPRQRGGRTKLSWVSFYNEELQEALDELRPKLRRGRRWIPIRTDDFRATWRIAREKTGLRITPKVLRVWFCCEMARLGVPDRYVDAFCGRVPRSILARHYSDFSPLNLKRIYDSAGLRVLT